MTENKNALTSRENEVLALTWQCFEAEPKVNIDKLSSLTGGSARFALGRIKNKLRAITAGLSEDNPTALAVKGGGRKPATKKRAAKSAENEDDEDVPKPKKRAKKATKGPDLNGDEVDKIMGLGGGEDVKVKPEPEDTGFGWSTKGDEDEV
ncbi:hypothetical protein N0V87_006537 [Didymella glomerata]|uniref:Uncharacterized protein n=1 Tax=Didymella glomerata TaxID=749621 RepID=A0A9W8WX96_9PLEO|nr:hypothetical protein N0V87_006537 [Didymella glomerata]